MSQQEFSITDFGGYFNQHAPRLMWFLGAGASRSAQIPTAWDITWELKGTLYCQAEGHDISAVQNFTSPSVRSQVQNFFDGKQGFPAEDVIEEYSFYFEQMFKNDEKAQRAFIEEQVRNPKIAPSYGHKFLALLLKERQCPIIWTTNFDNVIEDAYSKVDGLPSTLNVSHLDTPSLALDAVNEKRFPLIVKLHGDFRFENLKNTTQQLKAQNAEFSNALKVACSQYGMVVTGYSGRDKTVMDVFHSALDGLNPFPLGLFWFVRSGAAVTKPALELIHAAREKNVNAHIIEVGSFDELMMRIKKAFPKISSDLSAKYLDKHMGSPSVPLPPPGGGYPGIKTNAILIKAIPNACYKVSGLVLDQKAVNQTCKASSEEITAIVRNGEILIFAQQAVIPKVFGKEPEVFPLDLSLATQFLDHPLRSLLRNTMGRSLTNNRPLRPIFKKQDLFIAIDRDKSNDPTLLSLKDVVGSYLHGKVNNTEIGWQEAVRIKLDAKEGKLWLLLTPEIYLHSGDHNRAGFQKELETARDFVKNRTKMRRNYETARLLNVWRKILGLDTGIILSPLDTNILTQFSIENDFDSSGRAA